MKLNKKIGKVGGEGYIRGGTNIVSEEMGRFFKKQTLVNRAHKSQEYIDADMSRRVQNFPARERSVRFDDNRALQRSV